MCIFIVAIMAILLFYLSGSITHYQLSEVIDGLPLELAQGWGVLSELWPAMLFMFFAGVLFVLLIMKFWSGQNCVKDNN